MFKSTFDISCACEYCGKVINAGEVVFHSGWGLGCSADHARKAENIAEGAFSAFEKSHPELNP